MGKTYDENGEVLEFVATEKTYTRGVAGFALGDGGEYIEGEDGSVSLLDLLPDGVETSDLDLEDGDEYEFWIDVAVHKPTGEFKEDDD